MPPVAPSRVRDAFDADGFALVPGALPEDLIAAARDGFRDVVDGRFERGRPPKLFVEPAARDPQALVKFDMAHASDSRIRAVATHPAIAGLVGDLFACERVQLWASQLLIKPSDGGRASRVGWHQDYHYWRYWTPESELCTVWVALTDVAADCGPMRLIRGSHRWGYRGLGAFFHEQEQGAIVAPDGADPEEVPALLRAGGLSIHHRLTVHGSGLNTSGRPRMSLALHLRTERSQTVPGIEDYYISQLDDPEFAPVLSRCEATMVSSAGRPGIH
jgi:ectoine hydroxylase-related dioxygenase (phytanoyl-CoA dioxygenase family)